MLHPARALVAFDMNLYQTQPQVETKCYQQTLLSFEAFEALFSVALCLLERFFFVHLWWMNSSEFKNLPVHNMRGNNPPEMVVQSCCIGGGLLSRRGIFSEMVWVFFGLKW